MTPLILTDSYTATSTNTNLNGDTISNSNSDESAVYITSSGITISSSTITKSGDSSNTENSEFYGVNAAILVNWGGLTMTGSNINTSGKGANAIVATNSGTVTILGQLSLQQEVVQQGDYMQHMEVPLPQLMLLYLPLEDLVPL